MPTLTPRRLFISYSLAVTLFSTLVVNGEQQLNELRSPLSTPTSLNRGDLLIVGVNANNFACSGAVGQDEISFFSFKDIDLNTVLDITDCAFEHAIPGLWGENNEGKVRLTRTGSLIPAGTVITIRAFGGDVSVVSPDMNWSTSTHSGVFNLNSTDGDQVFFLQGGNWQNPTGLHNTAYTGGEPVYAFGSDPTNWISLTQQPFNSGLPEVMDCFSVAPTALTSYAKYNGPTSPTDQRTWIIRVGDPSNWTNYSSCLDYNTIGPDYLDDYDFELTTVGSSAGVWRGGLGNTNWFDCANWDNTEVPDLNTSVVIDDRSFDHCEIIGGDTATCADLTYNITGTNRQLVVNGSQLNVIGNLRMNKSMGSASGISQIQILNGAGLSVSGDLELTGYTVGLDNAVKLEHGGSGMVTIGGNLTIGQGGFLDLYTSNDSGGTLKLAGDFVNNHQEQAFDEQKSKILFNGTGPQKITGTGTFIEQFGTIILDKPTEDLTIDHQIQIQDSFQFSQGRALNLNTLVFDNGSTALGMSDLSFATGPCEKIGTQDFIFPVGKTNYFRPIGISDQTNANNTTSFIAEYVLNNPQVLFGNLLSPTLDHISSCEHWLLEQGTGTPNAFVSLGWESTTSCGISALPDLRIAHQDGTTWQDGGAAALTGNTTTGNMNTTALVSVFNTFTLASISPLNPLPVELLAFTARAQNGYVQLEWTTATEVNNDHFILERSSNGSAFETIGRVEGQGTTTPSN